MFERQPEGDPSATVMAYDREVGVPQSGHELDELVRDVPLRVTLPARTARCASEAP